MQNCLRRKERKGTLSQQNKVIKSELLRYHFIDNVFRFLNCSLTNKFAEAFALQEIHWRAQVSVMLVERH